jgi:hypothetical protein
MINRKQLLDDLKPLLRELEEDLRARCDEAPQIDQALQADHKQAREAGRTGAAYEQWRADLITQVGVAWVLSCVFVRFLEDNALMAAAKISGPLHGAGQGAGLMRARDERDLYFQAHPTDTDRDYLLHVFAELAAMPATAELFGPHNPLNEHPDWLSGDAAQKLIEFFQRIDADGTGEIVHDFTDDAWDTRFLGDLYQDLSEAARKKYALLQTPVFVEEFILERTLEPAIQEFGLSGLKMIDPACGSGHFLLGAFARILDHWRRAEPGAGERELINRALTSVHGVDINPYAVAIARFRLLLAAMRECGVTRLKDAPNFQLNLACGDSLLHGSANGQQQVLGFHELAHHYQSEDIESLREILRPGQYHAVVANPPYITVKDKALNDAYRERYREVCYGKYSLSAPFIQRLFGLALRTGFVGQITSNSFMKREFGKKLVEEYLPKIDLTHVIDTAGAYIPGHGTPTVILFGQNREPVSGVVRTVMGIQGEPSTPADPSHGQVWSAIVDQIDRAGSESLFVSVSDVPRDRFSRHPWSIGGGGAADLKTELDESAAVALSSLADSLGIMCFTLEDEVYFSTHSALYRQGVEKTLVRTVVQGEGIKDWCLVLFQAAVFPYDDSYAPIAECKTAPWHRYLWPYRTNLSSSIMFGRKTKTDAGLAWYEYGRLTTSKCGRPFAIAFGEVSTHNHFLLDRDSLLFSRSANVVQLVEQDDDRLHLGILGLFNSSTACFWLKQVSHNKGSTVDDAGARQRTAPFEDFYQVNSTKLEQFPLPSDRPTELARAVEAKASEWVKACPDSHNGLLDSGDLCQAWRTGLGELIYLQEELDWEVYGLYGLVGGDLRYRDPVVPVELGQRAFEIVLARKMEAGEEESTWFTRHGSTPITEIPAEWPEEYRQVVQRRIELIESDRNIGLIERPEYKRRWNVEPWEQQQERALRNWLLDRLESYFDIDGRMNDEGKVTAHASLREPRLTSIAQVADIARADSDFMEVAELYRGRADFDIGALVAELIEAESVPHLPILRYKPSGLDKRAAWERTWELQRLEDDIDALFEIERLKAVKPDEAEKSLRPAVQALGIEDSKKPAVLAELVSAAKNLANMVAQKLNLASEDVIKPITDAAKRAKAKSVGDIPVPPKYAKKDFITTGGARYWTLRGKLDVPKERWVSFPHCEGEDGSGVIAWAGYDHLQLAQAIAERFENARQQEGRTLVPLLASLGQLIPWLKQWHNDMDPTYGMRLGDFFEGHLETEAKALNMTVADVMAWQPPAGAKKTRKRKKKAKKKT